MKANAPRQETPSKKATPAFTSRGSAKQSILLLLLQKAGRARSSQIRPVWLMQAGETPPSGVLHTHNDMQQTFETFAAVEPQLSDIETKNLNAYFTPTWAAELLWDRFAAPLKPKLVCEPSCGTGNMLQAIPEEIEAYGIEIHQDLARVAKTNTNRQVLLGSFLEVPLHPDTDLFFGNPPFNLDLIEGLLDRAARLCKTGTRFAMVLPAFAFQTASRVCRLNEKWTIGQTALPRNFFPGIREPLLFGEFSLDPKPFLINLFLYHETEKVRSLPKWLQEKLTGAHAQALSRKGGWRVAAEAAVEYLGSRFSLKDLYSFFASPDSRPSSNQHWREKIRQTVARSGYRSLGDGFYAAQ